MFLTDPAAAPGSGPLKNGKQEAFCQLFACPDPSGQRPTATAAYQTAYKITDPATASAAASRLLTLPNVRTRVAFIRSQVADRLGIDRAEILAKRWEIAQRGGSNAARTNQLAALRDIEKALGFVAPETPGTTIFNGDVHNGDNTQFNGMFKITDPAAFARAAEMHRAARERSSGTNTRAVQP